jgi:hypothetical protein
MSRIKDVLRGSERAVSTVKIQYVTSRCCPEKAGVGGSTPSLATMFSDNAALLVPAVLVPIWSQL